MGRALDLSKDENIANVYEVDVLKAMLFFQRIWYETKCTVIDNCWSHTRLLTESPVCDNTDVLEAERNGHVAQASVVFPLHAHISTDRPP